MNSRQKQMSYIVVGTVLALLAVTGVTASSWRPSHTPLYTVRMEQASSEMNFLPTAKNNFAYTTGGEYGLNCDAAGTCCSAKPLGRESIEYPCIDTECNTCWATCVSTCNTCVSTCSSTCVSTCSTCVSTCSSTCVSTCNTCVYTCPYTCAATC